MFYIYSLYSATADKYYIGHINDVQLRVIEHNERENFNTFTSKFRAWKLAAFFECGTERSAAMKIERFIKKQNSRKLLEAQEYPHPKKYRINTGFLYFLFLLT